MKQENPNIQTLNNTNTTLPLKQKVYIFSNSNFNQGVHNPEHIKRLSLLDPDKKIHNIWKPKIHQKHLFQQPHFFMALQRKKNRIINGIKNMSLFCQSKKVSSPRKVKRSKQRHMSLTKMNNTLQPINLKSLGLEQSRIGWQPNNKTPNLNFNMQYLIKKRKSLTPNLYKGLEKVMSLISTK